MPPFAYRRAASLADARDAFAAAARGGGQALYLAGGQSLLPRLKDGELIPEMLVDLRTLRELRGIRRDGARIVIGAGETHADVARSSLVAQAIPALAAVADGIGDVAVRNLGTLGGALANNDPAADYPAAAVALAATIVTDHRRISAEAFFAGRFATALEPGEILVAVEFPFPARAGYRKVRNPNSGWPVAGVYVARHGDGELRVAIIGASRHGVFRSAALESALAADFRAEAVAAVAIDPATLVEDVHFSADYRAHLIPVLARRVLQDIAG